MLNSTPDMTLPVQQQLDAYNARDLPRFLAAYSEDVTVYRIPKATPFLCGKPALARFYAEERFNLPALSARSIRRDVVGRHVFDHEIIRGLRDADLEAMVVFEVTEGLITTVWMFYGDA